MNHSVLALGFAYFSQGDFNPVSSASRFILGNALVSLIYLFLAGLSLWLTQGLGMFVVGMFLAAGVAMGAVLLWGYRLLPGVWLGHFCFSVLLWRYTESACLEWPVLSRLALASAGPVLEAALGAVLLRRLALEEKLLRERDIVRFYVYSGPIACVLGPSVGVAMAVWATPEVAADVANRWVTWWLGDIIGVWVVLPIMLAWWGRGEKLWVGRRWGLTVPLLMAAALFVVIFQVMQGWIVERGRLVLADHADELHDALRVRTTAYEDAVISLERFFYSSEYVTQSEFEDFAEPFLRRYPGFRAVEWVPRVEAGQRFDHERRYGPIRERAADGEWRLAGQRDVYYPVTYIVPLAGNEPAQGYDLGSDATRLRALLRARDTHGVVASAPIHLVQRDHTNMVDYLLVHPVLARTSAKVRGYVVVVYQASVTVTDLASLAADADLNIGLYDVTNPARPERLTDPAAETVATGPWLTQWQVLLPMAGRSWRLTVSGDLTELTSGMRWEPAPVMVGGALSVAFLGGFILLIQGRALRIEQTVARRTAQLAQAGHRLETVVDAAGEGIVAIDADGVVVTFNPAAERLFGLSRQAVLGEHVRVLLPQPYCDQSPEALAGLFRANVDNWLGKSHRVTLTRRSGERVPVQLDLSRVGEGKDEMLTALFQDLSDVARSDRMKSEFLSIVDRELRTPLTAIRGGLDLVDSGDLGGLPAPARKMVTVAKDNSMRLTTLLDDMLELSELEAGAASMDLKPVKVATQVDAALHDNEADAERHGVTLVAELSARGHLWVRADQKRLRRVLDALLSNAIKHSPNGAVVRLRVVDEDGRVRFAVVDHGPGIDEAFQSRVFEKFAQADAGDEQGRGGAGLGLAIAKLVVEQMGGKIGFETIPGHGTTFYVDLPWYEGL